VAAEEALRAIVVLLLNKGGERVLPDPTRYPVSPITTAQFSLFPEAIRVIAELDLMRNFGPSKDYYGIVLLPLFLLLLLLLLSFLLLSGDDEKSTPIKKR